MSARVVITADGERVAIVRLSRAFMRRATAPGVVIAQHRGSVALGIPYDAADADIIAQARDAAWMDWKVRDIRRNTYAGGAR